MKHLSLLFLIWVSLATAATPVSRYAWTPWVEQICGQVIAALEQSDVSSQIPLIEAEIFGKYPDLFNSTLRREAPAYRKVVMDFVRELYGEGFLPMLATHSAEGILEFKYNPGMTVDELRHVFASSHTAARPLTQHRGKGMTRLTAEEIRITSANPLVQETVRRFTATGLGVYAIDYHVALQSQCEDACHDIHRAAELRVPMDQRQLFDNLAQTFLSSITRYGYANPVRDPKGVYLTGYSVVPSFQENLLHEMTHIVQDDSWDYMWLLETYVKTPVYRGFNGATIPRASEGLRLEMQLRRQMENFEQHALHPADRKKVLARGQALGMNLYGWLGYFDLIRLLAEMDAHQQASILAEENGNLGRDYRPENLLTQVLQVYQGQDGQLSALAEALADQDSLDRLLAELNRRRRTP